MTIPTGHSLKRDNSEKEHLKNDNYGKNQLKNYKSENHLGADDSEKGL